MARQEHPRENLLRDARALTPRVQIRASWGVDGAQEVFVGWRGKALSIYFDQDPVYHFDASGAMRRAFVAGRIFKAEEGRFASLLRVRSAEGTHLLRHELDPQEQIALLAQATSNLQRLAQCLATGAYVLDGQIPDVGDALAALAIWLTDRATLHVAMRPNLG